MKKVLKIMHWHFWKEDKCSLILLGAGHFQYPHIVVWKRHSNQKNQMIMRKQ